MPKNQQKQRGFQKVIVLWNVFKSKKTGSDFPLNRFSVCVNVFLWAKMHPKFFGQYRTILDFFNAGWRQLCNTLK